MEEEKKKIKIMIAAHKKYRMPEENVYYPIQVGAEEKESLGYNKDNTGDNISLKNPYYCELTAIYWAWKNMNADYIGLVHYRRYFKTLRTNIGHDKFKKILLEKEALKILNNVDVILPKKRKYYIETIYSHYNNTLNIETLDETRKIISEKKPEYLDCFDNVMSKTYAHMFNMFIMKKCIMDEYCTWLFEILEELENRIPPNKYDAFHARYLGRISEVLLDVWLDKNNIKYSEVPIVNMERVNWLKKGKAFLKAKFTNKKYNKSF